jgi:hypothetical protein
MRCFVYISFTPKFKSEIKNLIAKSDRFSRTCKLDFREIEDQLIKKFQTHDDYFGGKKMKILNRIKPSENSY